MRGGREVSGGERQTRGKYESVKERERVKGKEEDEKRSMGW